MEFTFGSVVGGIFLFIAFLVFLSWLRELLWPRTLRGLFKRFFGEDFAALQTHEKNFPGYDLASIDRALASFHAECCATSRDLGGCRLANSLGDLLPKLSGLGAGKPGKPAFVRLPVDVEEETSFATDHIHLSVLRADAMRPAEGSPPVAVPAELAYRTAAPERPEKIAAFLSAIVVSHGGYDEDLDARSTPQSQLTVSIACRSKPVADFFFRELEARRKRLSIFRGKVIDPTVSQGGISTIGFRRIERVTEADLILPADVKSLVRASIVAFYQHQAALRSVGVEMKRGILFHSPPGTGKTSISLYLAGLLPNFTVCFVSGQRLLYPRELCRMARYLQPTMIVFEDIDLIAQERDENGLATVLGELMNQIDGCEPDDQVLFLMNTNSLDRLERAVRNRPGRVDQIIQIPLPDGKAREELIRYFARRLTVGDDLGRVVAATEGATPAMLKEIVKRAAVSAVSAAAAGAESGRAAGDATPLAISQADLLLANEQVQFMRDTKNGGARIGFGLDEK